MTFEVFFNAQSMGIDHGHHTSETHRPKGCGERYKQDVGALADLFMLRDSCYAVVSYNSNWGKLTRTLRSKLDEKSHLNRGNSRIVSIFGDPINLGPGFRRQ